MRVFVNLLIRAWGPGGCLNAIYGPHIKRLWDGGAGFFLDFASIKSSTMPLPFFSALILFLVSHPCLVDLLTLFQWLTRYFPCRSMPRHNPYQPNYQEHGPPLDATRKFPVFSTFLKCYNGSQYDFTATSQHRARLQRPSQAPTT